MLVPLLGLLLAVFGTGSSQPTFLGSLGAGLTASRQQTPFCSTKESEDAYNRCIFNFGAQHYDSFNFLARHAPVCRVEVFRCTEVDKLTRCLNSQPTTVISDKCWPLLPQKLTKALHQYNIPCNYTDLEKRCKGKFTPLKAAAQRSSRGQGADLGGFRTIFWKVFNRIAPIITMIQYTRATA